MIHVRKFFLPLVLVALMPCRLFAEAPVVDDSENYALLDEQQQPSFSTDEAIALASPSSESEQALDTTSDETPLAHEEPALTSNNTTQAVLLEKIQSLQQELQELRGQLEVQAHDLKLLQQQQLAFYKDLDSRLPSNAASTSMSLEDKKKAPLTLNAEEKNTAKITPTGAPVKKQIQPTAFVPHGNPADEQISYLAGYELVKKKQYTKAMQVMETFVQQYPTSGYAPNAYYWLGEMNLLEKNYSKAIKDFETVLQQYPSSSKSAASLLKIGYAYAAMGHFTDAQKTLQQVVEHYPDTPSAQLAADKLLSLPS